MLHHHGILMVLSHRSHTNGLTPLRKIQAYPKEWWESVEWDHPNSKDALLPFLVLGAGARLLEEEGDEEAVEDNDEKCF